jgi:hypothetical protein
MREIILSSHAGGMDERDMEHIMGQLMRALSYYNYCNSGRPLEMRTITNLANVVLGMHRALQLDHLRDPILTAAHFLPHVLECHRDTKPGGQR